MGVSSSMGELIPGLIDELARDCLLRIPYEAFPSATSVSSSWALEIQLPEFHRTRRSSGLTRPVLVLAQVHFDPDHSHAAGPEKSLATPAHTLVLCEPGSGIWRRMEPIPRSSSGRLPMFCGIVGAGSDLVVIGGWDPETWRVSSAVHVYSFLTGKWRRGADMPGAARSFFGCESDRVKGTVLVAGGHDVSKNALRSAMLYDVVRDQWTYLPDMARERDECSIMFHRGKFHVISGYSSGMQGQFHRSSESFDMVRWQWDEVNESFLEPSPCQPACLLVVNDGEVYLHRDGNVAAYVDERWQTVAELPADVGSSPYIVTWHHHLMVVGSSSLGEPHKCYILDLNSLSKWAHIYMPSDLRGHVRSGCTFEL
ncbi:hypothetical protein Dimus_004348 [Dionaea muscipula]